MKLLLDQHLSPRLRKALQDIYPQSLHVRDAGLESATDAAIWEYARAIYDSVYPLERVSNFR